jgi:hypothetical protein
VTFGVDPLSRRSLLLHLPDETCQSFVLSSTRSALARERGVAMRALEGGEVGVLDLSCRAGGVSRSERHPDRSQ